MPGTVRVRLRCVGTSTLDPVASTTELGRFLRVRRAQLRPDDLGVVSYGARRVPGLRREELAQLAGVSPTYYTRLEQGQSQNASDAVLDAVATALRLTSEERRHLHTLARPPAGPADVHTTTPLAPQTRLLVTSIADAPVIALDLRTGVVAWNALGHALVAGHLPRAAPDDPETRPNLMRMLFLDPHTRELYPDRDAETWRAVASLRVVAAHHPNDPGLATLVGELVIKSPEFAWLWNQHPIGACTHGTKRLRHPSVGELELGFSVLTPADDSGHRLLVYGAEPGSPAHAALALLSL